MPLTMFDQISLLEEDCIMLNDHVTKRRQIPTSKVMVHTSNLVHFCSLFKEGYSSPDPRINMLLYYKLNPPSGQLNSWVQKSSMRNTSMKVSFMQFREHNLRNGTFLSIIFRTFSVSTFIQQQHNCLLACLGYYLLPIAAENEMILTRTKMTL